MNSRHSAVTTSPSQSLCEGYTRPFSAAALLAASVKQRSCQSLGGYAPNTTVVDLHLREVELLAEAWRSTGWALSGTPRWYLMRVHWSC